MSTSVSVSVLFAVIQVISSNNHGPNISPDIPKNCYGPPAGVNVLQCCPLPRMHSLEELKECGIERNPREPPLQARSDDQCRKKHCLMKNKGLLDNEGKVDFDKLETFLDTWSENETHIAEGVKVAKKVCLEGKEGPQEPFMMKRPDFCEPDVLYECVPINIIWNCQITDAYAPCRTLITHMEECKPFVYKTPPI